MCEELKIPFLGRLPIDPNVTTCEEKGQNFFDQFPASTSLDAIKNFAASLDSKPTQ